MSQQHTTPPLAVPLWRQHWPVLLTGMGLTAAAVGLHYFWGSDPPALRVILIFVGLLLAGQAVVLRLRQGREEVEERVESAAVIALAGFTALIAMAGTEKAWDSADIVLRALLVAAVCGVVLVLCAGVTRRVVISLLALYHFGGIVVAVLMLPPPTGNGSPEPFLATQAYTHLYRHYTNFIFMNNAYHFYSPEPGPPTLAWFSLNYEYTKPDGSKGIKSRWYKFPRREDSPVNLHYQRLLSVTESINQANPTMPTAFYDEAKRRHDTANKAGWRDRDQEPHPISFPDLGETPGGGIQVPTDWAKIMSGGVIRRVALTHEHHPDDPNAKLISIKFYRVRHMIISPQWMADGISPLDPRHYFVYYQGEYFPNGTLVAPDDPFLYWQIPIVLGPNGIEDHVERHAAMDYNWKRRDDLTMPMNAEKLEKGANQ